MYKVNVKFNLFVLILILFLANFVVSEGLDYFGCHPLSEGRQYCESDNLSNYAYYCDGVDPGSIKHNIETCLDLQRMGCWSTSYDSVELTGGSFYLMNDIDCGGMLFDSFNFGQSDKLTSIFDGQGHTIKNIVAYHGGLFDVVENAVIKNLKLVNFTISAPDTQGTLAILAKRTLIENVSLDGFTISGGYQDVLGAGGLVGAADYSYFKGINLKNGIIDVTIQDNIGGVLGYGTNVILENVNINEVSIQSNYYHNPNKIGGIVGYLGGGNIRDVNVGSEVTFGKMKFDIGGVAGDVSNTVITRAINYANIYPLETESTTDVSVRIGGIVGESGGATIISNSANFGNIHADENSYHIGGIIGYGTGLIHLNSILNGGNITGNEHISGIGNVYAYTKVNTINRGVVTSTSPISRDYHKCYNLRVNNVVAWNCTYDYTICPYTFQGDCWDNDYNNLCLVGYFYGYYDPATWLVWTPTDKSGWRAGFNCCEKVGPAVCDIYDYSSNAFHSQTDCSGAWFGSIGFDNGSEDPSSTYGDIIVASTVKENTLNKCESYCKANERLIYIGGRLPFCVSKLSPWIIPDSPNPCKSDGVCPSECNILNDPDCLDICVDDDDLCLSPCTPEQDNDCVPLIEDPCDPNDGLCGVGCSFEEGDLDCPPPDCGDEVCGVGEDFLNCPLDCPPPDCGDEVCGVGENFLNCPLDCPPPDCGDGVCGVGENFLNCSLDCPPSVCVVDGGVCLNDGDCCGELVCEDNICVDTTKIFSCIGSIDSNAVMCEGSNLGLIQDTKNMLGEACSDKKCEWVCREGFEKGSGVDENKCLLVEGYVFTCDESGVGDNWVIRVGDDEGLTIFDELTPFLSSTNTQRKCEYECEEGYELFEHLQRCVSFDLNIGVCGIAHKNYYVGESFSTDLNDFCARGEFFGNPPPFLINQVGGKFSWKCIHQDENVDCEANRVDEGVIDAYSILDLKGVYDGSDLIVNITCSKKTKAVLSLLGEENEGFELSESLIDCSLTPTTKKIKVTESLTSNKNYSLTASIKQSAPTCFICSKTIFFWYSKQENTSIPDNSIISLTVILLGVLTILLTPHSTKK